LFPRLSSTTWGMGIAPSGRIRRWGMRQHALRHSIPRAWFGRRWGRCHGWEDPWISRAMKGVRVGVGIQGGTVVGACHRCERFRRRVDQRPAVGLRARGPWGKKRRRTLRYVPRGIPPGTFFHREYHARGDRHRRLLTRDELGGGPYGACGAVQGHTPCPHADGRGHRRGGCNRGFRRVGKCLAGGRPGYRALEEAIVDAVRCAKGNGSVPAAAELQGNQGSEADRTR